MEKFQVLPEYDLNLFLDRVAGFDVDRKLVDQLQVWWSEIGNTQDWLIRFEKAVSTFPKTSPERKEALEVFKVIKESFDQINKMYLGLLTETSYEAIKVYFFRVISVIHEVPQVTLIKEMSELIGKFHEELMIDENDQIIALAEALTSKESKLPIGEIRTLTAQHAFREFVGRFPIQKIYYLYQIGEDQSTVDPLEIEKIELSDALRANIWDSNKRRKYTRIYGELHKNFQDLNCETDVKLGLNKFHSYSLGHFQNGESALDVLRLVESLWQGVKEDSTLQEFWDKEKEELRIYAKKSKKISKK